MDTKFREYGIKVLFPQRDLHLPDGSSLFQTGEPAPEPSNH
jgi:small-conductance mechanosensitive channel